MDFVKRSSRVWEVVCVLAMAGMASASAHGLPKSKAPVPEYRFELAKLGFPGFSQTYLNVGGSMMTVHFVDAEHLLFTYSKRGLVPRLENDPKEDDDRVVEAELIELRSGKVEARADWHLHDHGRYLWALGEGRFMVRIGDRLSTFAPVANLNDGPFQRVAFPHRPGRVEAILVSSDSKLLTVETKPPGKTEGSKPPVIVDLYRLTGAGTGVDPVSAEAVAALGTTTMVSLPIDGDGFLRSDDVGHGRWWVKFMPFGGKDIPLAPVDSSCPPTMKRVAGGLVVAVNCRGITGKVTLAAYDFAKHEIWEEAMAQSPVPSSFAVSAASGRFAMNRINSLETGAAFSAGPDTTASQEVRVYQTQTGDLLLQVNCAPLMRTAENFDLSPDGMRLVVVRGDALEVYHLPELSKVDREDLAVIAKLAPPTGAGKIDLKALLEGDLAAPASERDTTATVASGPPPTEGIQNGDTGGPRKPPTLLKPGEKPDFGKGNPPE